MEYLYNLSGLIILISWSLTNIFVIRFTAIVGYLVLLQYSVVNDYTLVFVWAILYILANLIRLILLLKEMMPRDLPEDLAQIKQQLFESMSTRDFLRFMKLSNKGMANDQQILTKGEPVKNLMLVTDGIMYIDMQNTSVELSKYHFIGEMSYFNEGRASNTVFAKDPVEFLYWSYEDIHKLQRKKPGMFMKLVEAMGKDIVLKMINQNNILMV